MLSILNVDLEKIDLVDGILCEVGITGNNSTTDTM
jgi:hypothetical protein